MLAGIFTRNERLGEADVTGAISRTMTAYALGLSFVMLIMAGATTLALMVLRINYYYVLGPIAGIAILLPYVGVFFSTIPRWPWRTSSSTARRPCSCWRSMRCCSSSRATS